MSKEFTFLQLSSLEKILLTSNYTEQDEVQGISALKGERVSYQILYKKEGEDSRKTTVRFSCNADSRLTVQFRSVGNVPCAMPVYTRDNDDYYLSKEPGLFPDVLYPIKDDTFEVIQDRSHSLFVTVIIPKDMPVGEYPVEIVLAYGEEEQKKTFTVKVLNACLPEQELTYTQWFHADCIASYYNQEVFSEQHWAMIEKFIKMASYIGINMILTPVFTLPLDTEVGGERPTVQLVDVRYDNGIYSFGFDKLKRWIKICKENGINKFEISHLFTQWGTGCTPKIEAETNEGKKKLFGWHVKADTPEYRSFLKAFIPQLIDFLKAECVYDDTYFHVSDEPDYKLHYECYKTEREILKGLIPDEKIMDAMSHYEFCESGLMDNPVVVTSSVDSFFERGINDIWAYYCCCPAGGGYSNRFIAMPSGRNRVTGMQLYKYGINGFLHWGYNFYYSQLSKRAINPFLVTDADEAFPSGDAFCVYPAEDGPIESIRSVVFYEALQDIRACKFLESYIGKAGVDAIIDENGVKSFNEYPRTDRAVAQIRERINNKIEEVLEKQV